VTLAVLFNKRDYQGFGGFAAVFANCNSIEKKTLHFPLFHLMDAFKTLQRYFDFKPLNPSLSFPKDLVSIPLCIAVWGIFHFVLSRSIFQQLESRLFKFKNQVDRLKYRTAGK
jgi:hypothetical protein